VLQVGLSSVVSSKGIEALSELHHLEQFIFADDECRNQSDWKLDSKFLLLSAKILPHLKVAGRHFDFLRVDVDLYSDEFNCIPGYHNEMLQNLHEPATLSLQLLSLRKDFLPNENIKFPLLEELMLWSPSSRTISVCDRFATVPAIGLYDCRDLDVLPVLRHVGQRLHSLVLDNFDQESTSLAEVLRLCPNLKRFRVSNTNVNKEAGPWPEASFWCMEEAYFETATLPNGFLKQVNNAL
jgi:hypothetical protein